jgi:hypothetical protein
MLHGVQQQQQHYEYSIEGPPGNGSGQNGQNPRIIASELNSYQSEKKISGNSGTA